MKKAGEKFRCGGCDKLRAPKKDCEFRLWNIGADKILICGRCCGLMDKMSIDYVFQLACMWGLNNEILMKLEKGEEK